MWTCAFVSARPLNALLDAFGRTPVPPYVHREGTREEEMADRARYQTIYAKHLGSVAAPTAGLHFTPEIFAALDAKGVRRVAVTLHVGPGTFRPVKAENIEATDADVNAGLEKMAAGSNGKTSAADLLKQLQEHDQVDLYKEQLRAEKAIDLILSEAK